MLSWVVIDCRYKLEEAKEKKKKEKGWRCDPGA
jgi:hypothetical protein